MDKMAASSRFATVSEDDFALKFFFLFFEIITCVFILKQLFASGSVVIGECSPIITSLSANNCELLTFRRKWDLVTRLRMISGVVSFSIAS